MPLPAGWQEQPAHPARQGTRAYEDAANRLSKDGKWSYKQARDEGAASIQKALNLEDWETECVKKVLDAYYKKQLGCTDKTEMVAPTGRELSATHFDDGQGNTCQAFELVDV